ncbi:RdgB/HAM1 family non-canonical purine NTP pyrophosphatase [Helicobacter mesocricetorum]|uniref:RdgB/HAM1 family non-canonical purine NTP pyrophosphatase n=1 Tax=Helicobacter mesocricetorum TaxID=87012 RepID=UPI000CF1BE44|nr:RdgB/HAM1 family non-canonical purine NTP pyrophosphatase [Helicobacter mesocricetorum]
MRLIIATSNPNKLQEIQKIYAPLYKDTLKILSFASLIQSFEIEENGTTFQENALLKSKAVFEALKAKNLLSQKDIILSDDSGICVEALQGAPGIYSARYSGGDDKANLKKLLLEIANLPAKTSKAYYCVAIGVSSFYGDFSAHGFMYGQVIAESRGDNGFGYDPMFIPKGFKKTLAELTSEEKNAISHRGIALKRANFILRALLFG